MKTKILITAIAAGIVLVRPDIPVDTLIARYADNASRFMRDIPGAVLITYPDLGHVPMEEAPARTAADAAAFLKNVSRIR